jgi:hypothetical protein
MNSAAICNTPNCDVREQQNDNPSPLMVELQQPAADSLADSNWEILEEIPVNEIVYETPATFQDERRVRFKRLPLQSTNWRRDLMQRPLHTRLLLPSLDTRNARSTQAAIEMQQICCSYFSTSIASVWTVETRCFLSSSNTGKNQTCLIFCPCCPSFWQFYCRLCGRFGHRYC